ELKPCIYCGTIGVHSCPKYRCRRCNSVVVCVEDHQCYIEQLEPDIVNSAEEACSNYYVFDFESQFVEQEDGSCLHVVNLAVVKKCFGDEYYVFYDLEEFVQWIEKLKTSATLFAHNLM